MLFGNLLQYLRVPSKLKNPAGLEGKKGKPASPTYRSTTYSSSDMWTIVLQHASPMAGGSVASDAPENAELVAPLHNHQLSSGIPRSHQQVPEFPEKLLLSIRYLDRLCEFHCERGPDGSVPSSGHP